MICICCCSFEFTKKYRINGFEIFRCNRCGFETTPSVTHEKIKNFYEKDYFDGFVSNYKAGRYTDPVSVGKAEILKKYNPKKILEIGPSVDGGMAKYYNGYKHYIEPSKYASEQLYNFGNSVFNGNIYDDQTTGYDLCIATEVIEHDFTPAKFINEIYKKLYHGGTLILSTGNNSSLSAKIMGKEWYYRDPPAHVNYFNSTNILILLSKFRKVKVYNYGFETIEKAKKCGISFMLPVISKFNIMTGMIIEATK